MDIRRFPRVLQLLGRADALARRERELEADDALLELGRYVRWLMQQDPEVWARIEAEGEARLQPLRTAPPGVFESMEELPSEELSLELSSASIDAAELPESSVEALGEDVPDLAPGALAVVDPSPLASRPAGVQAKISRRPAPRAAPWGPALRDLLGVLGSPPDVEALSADATKEGRRLLNGVSQPELRWVVFPDTVQVALVHLIASRAQAVCAVHGHDVSARMVLRRLSSFHTARELPAVKSLSRDARPEYASWPEDARHWWSTLVEVL